MLRILSKSVTSKPWLSFSGVETLPTVSNQLCRNYTTGEDADVVVTKKDQLLTIRLNRPKKVGCDRLL